MAGLDAFALIQPADALQFRILADERVAANLEVFGIHFPVRQLLGDAHELFLPFEQAQTQALLGVLDIVP